MFRGIWLGSLIAGFLSFSATASNSQGSKRSADLIVHSVKVHTTKMNGSPWDVLGGAPDLMVSVRKLEKGGAKHATKVKKDVFEASYGERTVRVSEGDEIEVIVYDEDDTLSDKVGEKKVKITEEMLKQREIKWEFDRVSALVLEFEP